MPIAPNTQYAKGRTPITPETPFPFDNCFFWMDYDMTVRVKGRPDGYDESHAVACTARQWCALSQAWMIELPRVDALTNKYSTESSFAETTLVVPRDLLEGLSVGPDALPSPSTDVSLTTPYLNAPGGVSSISDAAEAQVDTAGLETMSVPIEDSGADPNSCSPEIVKSVQDLFSLNIFGWEPGPSSIFLPLVNVWFELDAHLTSTTIPDPRDLKQEEVAIHSWVIPTCLDDLRSQL